MTFQPFGYRFEMTSLSSPSDVKAAIRSRKKQWFEPKNGARGWIAGPLICLWFSAFDRYGPMLFGRISSDNFRTKISGRAGSDLNGLAMLSLLMPVMALLLYQMVSAGGPILGQVAIIAGVMLLSPLAFWMSHKERKDAEPLVRFLRDAVTVSGRSLRAKSTDVNISKALTLNVGGEDREGSVTPESIHQALLGAGAGDFVILQSAPETYIQTASRDGGFVLETRQGDRLRHFGAVRRNTAPTSTGDSSCIFTFEETLAAFMAYGSETQMPRFLTWEPKYLPDKR